MEFPKISEELPVKNSNILSNALKKIENKSEEKNENENKNSSFPKYLANAFEQESKKDLSVKNEDKDNMTDVTKMIREKLKYMKPLS